jgi:ectoine hydroxylase-related dioxygenase (phytanoyl-CoA dioxygenase family)
VLLSAMSIEKEGFAIIPRVLEGDHITSLLKSLSLSTLPRSRAGVRHMLRHEAVSSLAHEPPLLKIARAVLGPEAFPFRATLFDKSPAANWLVAWHQDKSLPLRARQDFDGWGPWSVKEGVIYAQAPARVLAQVLALRVHLDDSTNQNGPLRVLPRTHTLGVLSDDEIQKLGVETVPINCMVSRGGVLAMKPLIVHSSSKLQVEASRRVLHIEYAASAGIADGMEFALA